MEGSLLIIENHYVPNIASLVGKQELVSFTQSPFKLVNGEEAAGEHTEVDKILDQ